jgi:mxaC protein
VAAAVRLIDRLETRPVTYTEIVPRRDDRSACYGTAAFCLLLVLLARLAQRDFPAAMPVPDILPP